jgi:hypothetical protein
MHPSKKLFWVVAAAAVAVLAYLAFGQVGNPATVFVQNASSEGEETTTTEEITTTTALVTTTTAPLIAYEDPVTGDIMTLPPGESPPEGWVNVGPYVLPDPYAPQTSGDEPQGEGEPLPPPPRAAPHPPPPPPPLPRRHRLPRPQPPRSHGMTTVFRSWWKALWTLAHQST